MENEETIDTIVDDESELDKSLQETLDSIKAGNVPTPEIKEEVKPEEGKEDPSEPQPKEDEKYEFRVPNKGKFESDESYEKRVALLDLVNKRKLAVTPEQKEALSEEIKKTKGQIKNLNGTDKVINQLNTSEQGIVEEEDETIKSDKERLNQLGVATKEDVQAIIEQTQIASDVKNTLDKFVDRHSELKDEDAREVFFDFVEDNFNWKGKTGKDLMTVLELARESMFKPAETISERVLKGAGVAEKVNAMQFPGGTVVKASLSPEMKESVEELKRTGMSEEKALELLS